jgi:hypothetical protein
VADLGGCHPRHRDPALVRALMRVRAAKASH